LRAETLPKPGFRRSQTRVNRIDPDNDPNEACEIKNVAPEMCGPPPDWWMVTCNGSPVRFYAPAKRHLAERYASDPIYRRSPVAKKGA
jgi:hypothetical protein